MAAVCALAFSACDLGLSGESSSAPSAQTPAIPTGKTASVYYLDVGQGDSELIQLPGGENILIDAGDRGTSDEIVSYLKEKGIQKIDLLIPMQTILAAWPMSFKILRSERFICLGLPMTRPQRPKPMKEF